ncbi:sugar transferase [Paeniglutamicibacter sp.]|uniref:sugar transferase n=1 Tax=Paeniglutamicibacter sp. TaxID=1934391 RepID=UPI003989A9A7
MSTQHGQYDVAKRCIDILGAAVGLVVLSPVIAATAVVVRVKLGSPVMFVQERPGRNGKVFELYKFRSMLDIDISKGLIADEDRLTSFGKILRSTSLDELPSLVNVLKGDMSLVGPRPLLVEYLDRYSSEQSRRHEVKPGVTGLAQVRGRNAIEWDEKLALDVEYVVSRCLLLDIKILWETARAVAIREGITHDGHVTMNKFEGNTCAN